MDDMDASGDTASRHLRAAARELIAAGRSFLDVAEELVEDPRTFEEAGELLRGFVERLSDDSSTGPTDVHPGASATDESARGADPGRVRGDGAGGTSGGADGTGGARTVQDPDDTDGGGCAPDENRRGRKRSGRVTRIEVE